MLTKIISGGQTGTDQGALHGARVAGIETGGTAPKGWRTEAGPNLDLLKHYGLIESQSNSYIPRTRRNILDSDGTLIFGDVLSSGSNLTRRICVELGFPHLTISWRTSKISRDSYDDTISWIETYDIEILNVAGNRESVNPGIHEATSSFVVNLVKELEKEQYS